MGCNFCKFEYGVSVEQDYGMSYSGYTVVNELRPVSYKDGRDGVIHLTRVLNGDETEVYCKSDYDVSFCPKCGREL